MSDTIEVRVPDIGDFKDVEIIEVLVRPGERIAADQSLITVESDKASMEIPSSAAGVVESMRVNIGDKVSEGSVVLTLRVDAAVTASGVAAGVEFDTASSGPIVTHAVKLIKEKK